MNNKKKVSNGFGIASFILSLIALPLILVFGLGLILSLLAIIFGIIQLAKKPTWQAIAGLILGIVGPIIMLFMIVILWQIVQSSLNNTAYEIARQPIPN